MKIPRLCIPLLLSVTMHAYAETSEIKIIELKERVYGTAEVVVELILPEGSGPFPVIISQHGSERDGKKFGEGATDEYSTRLVKKAAENGFAVVILDAFYKKNLSAGDKNKFPRAENYARQIRNELMKDSRFIGNQFFYTGFSYGGRSVLNSLYFLQDENKWRALAAAEPDCNSFIEPQGTNSPPILILKGEKSHYYPKACEILTSMYKQSGTEIEYISFPNSNHYFSHNGKITEGIAFNGCTENPVIIYGENNFKKLNFKRYDGSTISLREINQCFTKTAGSGKTREDLDNAIESVIKFFKKQLL